MKRHIALLPLAGLFLAGCGWLGGDDGLFRDRSHDYRSARLDPELQLPPHLSRQALEDEYFVPADIAAEPLDGRFEVPRPEPLVDDPLRELVKIQRLADERWILVEAPPGQIWPRVRGFLNQQRLQVARLDATAGVMETNWFQPADDSLPRERYRLRIEQGVQRNTSEVYILQASAAEGEDWPARSSDQEREALVVQELAQFIANTVGEGGISMLAEQALEARGKVFLERDAERQPYLRLELPFLRAWGSLGLALDRGGFSVEDTNRSERLYWVEFRPEAEEDEDKRPGWLRGLIRDLFPSDTSEDEPQRYRVRMGERSARAVDIRIEGPEGESLPAEEAERLLNRIKGFLS